MIVGGINRASVLLALLLIGCGNDAAQKPADNRAQSPATAQAPAATNAVSDAQAATPTKSTGASAKMAPTPATVARDTELKEKPFTDAKTLKRLPARTAVTIVDRDGGWLKVTAGGQQGWVRLLHVSSQPASSGGTSTDELKSAAKMATGRAGSGNIVSTTGIRGLSEEQLREAKPNPQEFQRLEGYAASKEQATAYARAQKLERRQVAHLPGPP
jgi:uncharacterized protein YgiM (DUF1202 family)